MSNFDSDKKKDDGRKKSLYDGMQNEFFKVIHSFLGGMVRDRSDLTKKKKEETLIIQFVLKIKSIFNLTADKQAEEKEQIKLLGRIQELNNNAEEVLNILNTVREDLKKEVDGELYSFVESVMNPMIRDISRIQKIVKRDGLLQRQADAFNQYNEWIDRAKLWVQVCSTAKNKDVITEAIIKHTIEDFTALIDRDVQLIYDYQEHLLNELQITEYEKKVIKDEIQEGLKPYLKSLLGLKNHPKGISLDNLNKWKDHADKRRDRYFNGTLQFIDNKTKKFNPSKESEEEHDVLIESFEQISYLEMEIPLLIEKIAQNPKDSFEVKVTLQQLMALEEEVDQLYHDISLPPTIIERLQRLKKLLKNFFLKNK